MFASLMYEFKNSCPLCDKNAACRGPMNKPCLYKPRKKSLAAEVAFTWARLMGGIEGKPKNNRAAHNSRGLYSKDMASKN